MRLQILQQLPKGSFQFPPKILLLVFWFLVPPLVHGLKTWFAINCPATPAAAPASPASRAPLPVKNLVLGLLLFPPTLVFCGSGRADLLTKVYGAAIQDSAYVMAKKLTKQIATFMMFFLLSVFFRICICGFCCTVHKSIY